MIEKTIEIKIIVHELKDHQVHLVQQVHKEFRV
jgi:hypothetical protein